MGRHNKKISDPGLWRRIVREVRDRFVAELDHALDKIFKGDN